MADYLVEHYRPGSRVDQLEQASARLREASRRADVLDDEQIRRFRRLIADRPARSVGGMTTFDDKEET